MSSLVLLSLRRSAVFVVHLGAIFRASLLMSHLFLTERMLGQSKRPADIIKLRMKQAGYDAEDGAHLLGIESLGISLNFVYQSQLLAGVRWPLLFFFHLLISTS